MTPGIILERAADIIDERGWYQGGYEARDGRVCAAGAIRLATGLAAIPPIEDTETVVLNAAYRALEAALPTHYISTWNDWPHQTKEQVTGTLRQIAAQLQASEAIQLAREAEAMK